MFGNLIIGREGATDIGYQVIHQGRMLSTTLPILMMAIYGQVTLQEVIRRTVITGQPLTKM